MKSAGIYKTTLYKKTYAFSECFVSTSNFLPIVQRGAIAINTIN